MGNCMCRRRQNEFVRKKCRHCGRIEDKCMCLGGCLCPLYEAPLPSCVFYSPRIQGLHEGESTELETTQEHWTVMDPKSLERVEKVGEENRKYFDEVLVKHPKWGAFFSRFEDLKVGEKIGEGGQGEIFAATHLGSKPLVAKVFKKDVPLRDLEKQWPPQMMAMLASKVWSHPFTHLAGGEFIRDGKFKNRFAFMMYKGSSDLRTLIDGAMLRLLKNNHHRSPFIVAKAYVMMISTSSQLCKLHKEEVVHKASNVLYSDSSSAIPFLHQFEFIDYECSVGVLGTGFWRAPEILKQVLRKVPSHEVMYTKKADICSFGMLCYEIITGLIPFEGQPQNDYRRVLKGERPRLLSDLSPFLEKLLHDCWEHDPQRRPSATKVHSRLLTFYNL